MFGDNDQNQTPGQPMASQDTQVAPSPAPVVASMPSTDAPATLYDPPVTTSDNTAASSGATSFAPSAPTIPDPMVTPSAQPASGVNGVPVQDASAQPEPQVDMTQPGQSIAVDPDLAQIKQQALQSLEPLVSQLDQAPEEKFKTIMMLIQSSDNSKMLKDAYAAASQITDEKVRAQALLDVINEINYFSTQAKNG